MAKQYTIVRIFRIVLHSVGVWVVFTSWLSRMMLLRTFTYQFLCSYVFMPLGIAGLYGKSVWTCLTGPPNYFPKWTHSFTFLRAVFEGSGFSSLTHTWGIHLSDYSHLCGGDVVSHCSFHLNVSNGLWCGSRFHVLVYFLGINIQILCPFLNWGICLFVFWVVYSIYKPFSNTWFENIFSHYVDYLFNFLIVLFGA